MNKNVPEELMKCLPILREIDSISALFLWKSANGNDFFFVFFFYFFFIFGLKVHNIVGLGLQSFRFSTKTICLYKLLKAENHTTHRKQLRTSSCRITFCRDARTRRHCTVQINQTKRKAGTTTRDTFIGQYFDQYNQSRSSGPM